MKQWTETGQGTHGAVMGDRAMSYWLNPTNQTLKQIATDLAKAKTESDATLLWSAARRVLKLTHVDPLRAARVCGEKNLAALAQLGDEVASDTRPLAPSTPFARSGMSRFIASQPVRPTAIASPAASTTVVMNRPAATMPAAIPAAISGASAVAVAEPETAVATVDEPSANDLRSALRAFKKRLKITKLDEESKLSNRALTGGKKSAVVAIQPPTDYPRAVWEKLADEGKLKRSGRGLYSLIEE